MPQTRLSHGALSFLAPPPGEAHLSDALGAGMVACPPAPVAASGAVDGLGRFAAWPSVSLSLDTHSIWQETFQETFIEGQRDSTPIRLLRPVHFASVLPPAVVGLWSVIYRTQECRLVVFFQPRRLKLFLSQNFVNVLHASPFHGQNNGSE